jgi:hypothetical protein
MYIFSISLLMLPRLRPRLLVLMAEKKRKETGDNRYYAPLERQKVPLSQRFQTIVAKPFKILFAEPMLIAITLYMSVSVGPSISIAIY